MSASKRTSAQTRRSPVGSRKSKTPRKSQPVSNGLHEFVPEPAQRSRSASLGKDEVLKMNLKTVRKLDSSVKSIKSTVPQVVLYQYESTSNTWERTSVEGTLFVCERESTPRFGFVVLNTLHSENSMEAISPGMGFRVQEPFVLYKNQSASKIYGLCFQEKAACKEMGDLLNRLSDTSEQVTVNNGHSKGVPMRSASAIEISLNKSEHAPKVNVLEMLETANRSYLGQAFSDSTSSPDSLTSEPIQFATNGASTPASSTMEQRNTHSTPTQHTKIVTPASYPVKVPGVRVTSRSGSVSPQKQSRSCMANQYQFQHAASFDNDHFGTTPNSARNVHSSDHSRSLNQDSGIVRKLFNQSDQNGVLSQSMNFPPVSTRPPSSVPLRAISLDEVEKQMTAEVSTPELNIPFSLLTTSANIHPPEPQQPSILIQPSMFVSTAASSPIKTHSTVTTQPLAFSVQPPTPITTQQEHSFPPIPPLMHSAGMKAPPIKPTNGAQSPRRNLSDSVFQVPSIPHRAVSDPMPRGKSQTVIQPTLSPLPELLTSQPRNTSPISSTLMSPHQFSAEPIQSSSAQDTVGLSREQLLQAFEYLLKHDEHFVDQLHGAYKQSLLSRPS